VRKPTRDQLLRVLVYEVFYFFEGGQLWILATHWPSLRPGLFDINDWIISLLIVMINGATLAGVLAQRRGWWRP
jgi:hypothetical protein